MPEVAVIISLLGKNTFLLEEQLQQMVEKFRAAHGDNASLERIDGEEAELERIVSLIGAQSLFAQGHQLIIIRRLSKNKTVADALVDKLGNVPPSTTLVFYEPEIDKRSSFYKQLKKLSKVYEPKEYSDQEAAAWLARRAKDKGVTLSRALAEVIVDRAGPDLWRLSGELDKLRDYGRDVTKADIELLVEEHPRNSVFELLDTVSEGKSHRALELYARLRKAQAEPMFILSMIIWHIHLLAVVKAGHKMSDAELMKMAKISPFVLRKLRRVAGRVTMKQVKEMVDYIAAADLRLKTTPVDPDDQLETLVTQLSLLVEEKK